MNRECETLIIGASKEGIAAYKYLNDINQKKILFVSNTFSFTPDEQCIQAKAVYAQYRYGLILVSLDNRDTIVCKKVILATGDKPKELIVAGYKNIRYKYEPVEAENIVVYGNNNDAVKWVIEAAKTNKFVVLCSSSVELKCTKALQNKLNKFSNITWLPNCQIKAINKNIENNIVVELNTYTTIECQAIFASIGREYEKSFLENVLVETDSDHKILTNEQGQTKPVKEIIAIGSCAGKNFKTSYKIIKEML